MNVCFVRAFKFKRQKNSQNFLVFKFMAICLFLVFLQVSAKSFSQNVTISMENVSLQKVFNDINRQTGRQFFFKDELLNKAGKVNINVKDMPLKDALAICFKNYPLAIIH